MARIGLGGLPLLSLLFVACADPCVDDGLGQKECPEEQDGDDGGSDDDADTGEAEGEESGEGDGGTCDLFELDLTPQTPTLLLLVDQSGSMTADFDQTNRWDAIRTTLLDPVTGVVATLESEIRFGLALYTSNEGDIGGMCPILTETPPAIDNYAAIQMTFDNSGGPVLDTPTGESLAAVTPGLVNDPEPGDKYIVLATDGEPDTCAEPNPQNGQAVAVAAAEDAFSMGIRTFVISVGDQVSDAHLQDMANAGQGVQPNDPDAVFYKALDQQALIDAFNDIIQGVRDCRIDLADPIFPDKANLCDVTVNGMDIPFDDPDGWQVNAADEIELVGSACTSIQEGDVTVGMQCDCEAVQ